MTPRYTFKTIDSDNTTDRTLTTYRFRAECAADVVKLYEVIPQHSVVSKSMTQEIENHNEPDCIVQVYGYDLEAMREFCRGCIDSHVIMQTIQPASQYTGERDYAVE